MDNKTMLEGILWDLKCLSDLFMHGTIESADNKVVHDTFMDSLNTVLEMQENLYTLMSEEDMYKVTTVSETKIKNTREKFNENLEEA
uniref:spore coat protein n=1 Tax=Candidatus Ventrenecus sp. TaxID=3085654 RepID=UPI003FEFF762